MECEVVGSNLPLTLTEQTESALFKAPHTADPQSDSYPNKHPNPDNDLATQLTSTIP